MRKFGFVLAVLFVSLATAQMPTAIRWRPLASGQQSTSPGTGITLFRSEGELQNYWRGVLQMPGSPPRGVDWTQENVLVVNLGKRSTGGYSVIVQRVEEGPRGEAIIRASELTPMAGSIVTQQITSPWTMIRIDSLARNFKLSLMSREKTSGVYTGASPFLSLGTPFMIPLGDAVAWKALASGQQSNATASGVYRLGSEGDLASFWSHTLNQPAESAPSMNVDWTKEQVVAVLAGKRPNGGFRFTVGRLDKLANGKVIVRVWEQEPIPGQFVTQQITSPWILLRVDSLALEFELRFEKIDRQSGIISR